jgi:hypothetical protein
MTKTQFGFAVGFAIAVVWALAGFLVVIAAVVAGLLGFALVRVLEGSPEVSEFMSRLSRRQDHVNQ